MRERVLIVSADLRWRDVGRCGAYDYHNRSRFRQFAAEICTRFRNPFGNKFCEAKIEHLRLSSLCHENIRGFDVAVDYSFGVGGIQSFGYLDPKLQRFFEWKRFPTDMTAQCFAVNELHGDESSAVLLADVIDRANARMIQGGCGSHLPEETLQRLCILAPLSCQVI